MATTQFILKITEITEIQYISDRFYKAEVIGTEVRNDDIENTIKVQGNNKMAEKIQQFLIGEHIHFICEIEGRRWFKDGKTIIFQNLVLKEYKTIGVKTDSSVHKGEENNTKRNPTNVAGISPEEDFPF